MVTLSSKCMAVSICENFALRQNLAQHTHTPVFPALIVHSELKSVHLGFPVAFIFKHKLINK